MDITTLMIWVFTGVLWTAYFMFWKKESKWLLMFSWAWLCVYPYFTDNVPLLIVIWIILLVLPFLFDF